MGDYFEHWLALGRREGVKLPKVFCVNWFRKDEEGKFLWPGYGENSRVLAWIFGRCQGTARAEETPIGLVPSLGAGGIDRQGLEVSEKALARLLAVDPEAWKAQLPQIREHLARFGDRLPPELRAQLRALEERLG
jgi:phosphoenolpyruvate carboxykinase (GTP)